MASLAQALHPNRKVRLAALVARAHQPSPRSFSAADAVASRLLVNRDLLNELVSLVEANARLASADPGNWGYAGDQGYVAERLAEIVSSIAGLEELSAMSNPLSPAEAVAAADQVMEALVGATRPDPSDVVGEFEARGFLLVGPLERRILAGLIESIAHSRELGLPGLAVDLDAGIAGLEAALIELESVVYSHDRGLS